MMQLVGLQSPREFCLKYQEDHRRFEVKKASKVNSLNETESGRLNIKKR